MLFSTGAELLSVNETAVALKCSRSQIYKLYKHGQLVLIRHNNRLWAKPSEIEDYFTRLEAEAKKDRATKHRAATRRRPATKDTTCDEPHAGSSATNAA